VGYLAKIGITPAIGEPYTVHFFVKERQHVWLAVFNDDYKPEVSLAVQATNKRNCRD